MRKPKVAWIVELRFHIELYEKVVPMLINCYPHISETECHLCLATFDTRREARRFVRERIKDYYIKGDYTAYKISKVLISDYK